MQIITPQRAELGSFISRASTATYLDGENILRTAAVNEPRPIFDDQGNWRGIYTEPAATNMVGVDAENLSAARSGSNGWYTGTDLANIFDVTANSTDISAVDGGSSKVTKFVRNSTAASEGIFARNTPGTNIAIGSYRQSIWIYVPTQSGIDNFQVGMDIGNIGSPGFAFSQQSSTFDTWVRLDAPLVTNAVATFLDYMIVVNGGTSVAPPLGFTFYAMNAQLESGASLTSFIPTAGGTRAAETKITPTTATIVYTNVPVENIPEWSAGTYSQGTERIYENNIYRVSTASTTDRPDQGAVASPPTWVLRAPVNRLRMFDLSRSEDVSTTNSGTIDVVIYYPEFFNGVGLINISGGNALFEVIEPGQADPSQSISTPLVSTFEINSFYKWYFQSRTTVSRTTQTTINGRAGSLLRVRLTPRGGTARIGKLVTGLTRDIGRTQSGVSIRTVDQSPNERNEFGDVVLRPGRVTTVANFTVSVPFRQTDGITELAKSLASTNTVFIGEGGEGYGVTILYGYAQEYEATLATGPQALYRITVESI